jgi:hypothetical protein
VPTWHLHIAPAVAGALIGGAAAILAALINARAQVKAARIAAGLTNTRHDPPKR